MASRPTPDATALESATSNSDGNLPGNIRDTRFAVHVARAPPVVHQDNGGAGLVP